MSKVFKFALSSGSKYLASCRPVANILKIQQKHCVSLSSQPSNTVLFSSTSAATQKWSKSKNMCSSCFHTHSKNFSTEVDKEISKFLEKEIQFENSRSTRSLPNIPGFEISADGGDLTFTKVKGSEKVVVRLSVNGATDSITSENDQEKSDEPPQMVCKPPFEVEFSKGDGKILALQCSFPSQDELYDDPQGQGAEQIDDQFEIQEVAIHSGEWKDTTFSVSAATMDAELFDLLMDMLDERGINDEFIGHLVDYCTAYENKQYVDFLASLKSFSEK